MRRLALAAGTVLAVSPATALAATPPLTGSFTCEDQFVVQPGDTASCSFPAALDLHAYDIPERFVMLAMDQHEITGPGTGTHLGDGRSSFRRILVPVRSPGESAPALAAAARICGLASGVLRLVHVRTCDPPLRSAARFYRESAAEAAAMLEEALLTAWACGGPRATTALVDAGHGDVATAIMWQASAWHADLIVLTRRPRSAIARLVGGSVADQVMRTASCPVLAVPLQPCDADPVGHTDGAVGQSHDSADCRPQVVQHGAARPPVPHPYFP